MPRACNSRRTDRPDTAKLVDLLAQLLDVALHHSEQEGTEQHPELASQSAPAAVNAASSAAGAWSMAGAASCCQLLGLPNTAGRRSLLTDLLHFSA